MHRTVFDFLDRPGTWELSCLQLKDQSHRSLCQRFRGWSLHLIHNRMIQESSERSIVTASFAFTMYALIQSRALPCSFASIQATP